MPIVIFLIGIAAEAASPLSSPHAPRWHKIKTGTDPGYLTSEFKDVPLIGTGEATEFSKCTTRSAAIATFDLRRGRGVFGVIENNAQCVAIDADNSKTGTWNSFWRNPCGF
jgi:hypothetical protein